MYLIDGYFIDNYLVDGYLLSESEETVTQYALKSDATFLLDDGYAMKEDVVFHLED